MILVAECVAGLGFLQADEGNDVACYGFFDFNAVFCFDFEDTADTLLLALVGVFEGHTGFDDALEYAGEHLLTYEGVVDELECQSRNGCVCGRFYDDGLALVVGILAVNIGKVERRGEVVNNGVKHEVDTFILIGRTAEYGCEHQVDGGLADRLLDFLYGDGLGIAEILFHERLVNLGNLLQENVAALLVLVFVLGGTGDFLVLLVNELVALAGNDVDYSVELVLRATGNFHLDGLSVEDVVHLLNN